MLCPIFFVTKSAKRWVSERVIVVQRQISIFRIYHGEIKLHFDLDSYNASSQKQQSVGRHVAPLGHIILIPTQLVFALIT